MLAFYPLFLGGSFAALPARRPMAKACYNNAWGYRQTCSRAGDPAQLELYVNVVGIGTDIVECLRIAQMIERHGELFITRVYTQYEIGYCQSRRQATQHFAGRWAAKEAVLKALGTGWRRGISWRDIEVRNDAGGRPLVALRGGVREVVEQQRIGEILISISHCRSHATAYAMALAGDQQAPEPNR